MTGADARRRRIEPASEVSVALRWPSTITSGIGVRAIESPTVPHKLADPGRRLGEALLRLAEPAVPAPIAVYRGRADEIAAGASEIDLGKDRGLRPDPLGGPVEVVVATASFDRGRARHTLTGSGSQCLSQASASVRSLSRHRHRAVGISRTLGWPEASRVGEKVQSEAC